MKIHCNSKELISKNWDLKNNFQKSLYMIIIEKKKKKKDTYGVGIWGSHLTEAAKCNLNHCNIYFF